MSTVPDGIELADWLDFEASILSLAETIRQFDAVAGERVSKSERYCDLAEIDKALTKALQAILPLLLKHEEGQDLCEKPFNHRLVQDLQQGLHVELGAENRPIPNDYPTTTIKSLQELRDAARKAMALNKPGRGNSQDRDRAAALGFQVGRNFVFRYRSRFSHMPPMSQAGPVVELLARALEKAGAQSHQAADILRRAIEADKAGRKFLPSATEWQKTRRPK